MPQPTVRGYVQSLTRGLLGLRGGPLMPAVEAVQPVALIASGELNRDPTTEVGDTIPRRFLATVTPVVVALEYSQAFIRISDVNSLVVIEKIFVTNTSDAAGKAVRIQTHVAGAQSILTTVGTARFTDARLPSNDIGVSGIDAGGDSAVAIPTVVGGILYGVPFLDTRVVDGPFVLVDVRNLPGGTGGVTLSVTDTTAGQSMTVSFQGIVFALQR